MAIIWSRELDDAFDDFLLPGEKLTHVAVAMGITVTTTSMVLSIVTWILFRRWLPSQRQIYLLFGLTRQRLLILKPNSGNQGINNSWLYPLSDLVKRKIRVIRSTGRILLTIDPPIAVGGNSFTFLDDYADRNLERAQNLTKVLSAYPETLSN